MCTRMKKVELFSKMLKLEIRGHNTRKRESVAPVRVNCLTVHTAARHSGVCIASLAVDLCIIIALTPQRGLGLQ